VGNLHFRKLSSEFTLNAPSYTTNKTPQNNRTLYKTKSHVEYCMAVDSTSSAHCYLLIRTTFMEVKKEN